MLLRGARRRRGVDRGFVLSDHADWPGLMEAIHATGAQQVIVTHGSIPVMVRWLCQIGLDAKAFDTEYGEEDDEAVGATPAEPQAPAAARANVEGDAESDPDAEAKDA
jgi:putative mRNA 3-end processing factor